MAVDAIGSSLGTQQNSALAQSSTIDQEDFIRLFLAQLQFQDPLEPVDNREFLAQLAQFSALEQSRQLSENTASMLAMSASDQAVGLLNRQVDLTNLGVTRSGTVVAVQFGSAGPELSVRDATGSVSTGIRLSQISLVKP
ncbi:flagellar hook capping protein [Stenotrophomonas maltophilia]|uniref:Basal-body rod modification protein FlgD n=1 Tax=Stenotrophomonas maltophilia TaxID=40324 RepID=A0A6B8J2Z0_STEMA|nr:MULTISPECIES: flagellar hook capping FlgD N-terminal domain-containing protein [Stenotrophomonas]KAA3601101.1 flagellar hook capping protein [Stenotrophomonas maltophilia]KOO78087.1 flagellar hook capping protein [Stenotrophomonas maltophilia]KRG61239.1 flagellar hook capping protein [Stenotrophomonas maltophilia]MBH1652077.1 flagellar hook capping protein [Stenotrophomonas maltophilia]MBN5125825.1 flagellar hook capping protein [Stenotrophomonas maltophilia]